MRNNGTLGLSLCFVEENVKFNRFRTLADISVKPENRSGPARLDIHSPEMKALMELDMHANNYRDGEWGSVRHIVVKDGEGGRNLIFSNREKTIFEFAFAKCQFFDNLS